MGQIVENNSVYRRAMIDYCPEQSYCAHKYIIIWERSVNPPMAQLKFVLVHTLHGLFR